MGDGPLIAYRFSVDFSWVAATQKRGLALRTKAQVAQLGARQRLGRTSGLPKEVANVEARESAAWH